MVGPNGGFLSKKKGMANARKEFRGKEREQNLIGEL